MHCMSCYITHFSLTHGKKNVAPWQSSRSHYLLFWVRKYTVTVHVVIENIINVYTASSDFFSFQTACLMTKKNTPNIILLFTLAKKDNQHKQSQTLFA